jgi:hypothetical protein
MGLRCRWAGRAAAVLAVGLIGALAIATLPARAGAARPAWGGGRHVMAGAGPAYGGGRHV